MHLSYISQKTIIDGALGLPCWALNPLHLFFYEHKVLFIHTPDDLPEDVGAAIISEIAVFNRTKTLLYSPGEGNVAVVKRLMDQLSKVEDLAKENTQLSKELNRFTDSVKVIEKAPLYINDQPMSKEELLDDIRKVMDARNERGRHRIVIIDDFLALKGMVQNGNIDRAAGANLQDALQHLAAEYNISFVVMSRKPLKEAFSVKAIRKAFATIGKKEYGVETILSDGQR